jgi:hypothetical protein
MIKRRAYLRPNGLTSFVEKQTADGERLRVSDAHGEDTADLVGVVLLATEPLPLRPVVPVVVVEVLVQECIGHGGDVDGLHGDELLHRLGIGTLLEESS